MPAPSGTAETLRVSLLRRAHELVAEHLVPGALGALLSGSAVYPGTPAADCDLDIFLVLEDDALARIPSRKRTVMIVDRDPPRRKIADIVYVSVTETEEWVASTSDSRHWPLQYAVVLHDPQDLMRSLLQRGAALSDATREDRMRVHHAELVNSAHKARRRLACGDTANARLVVALAVRAAVKLLSVVRGSWAPLSYVTWDALREIGVPEAVLDVALRASENPAAGLEELLVATETWLSECGHQFHLERFQLRAWRYSPAGRAANERWGYQF
ncbi:MAG: hypothetical protein H0T42_12490 [Deltaproteobacteria bacterium]|nr:hypothetical protein [Deltaproteobacteria bacterium]